MPSRIRVESGPRYAEDTPGIARQFVSAIRELPAWGREEVLRRLMNVIAHHERTDDASALEHFLRSLDLTAHMEHVPAYLTATAEREDPVRPRDITDVIAEIEACHRGTGA